MMKRSDVVLVGAGIVGLSLARALTLRGLRRVVVLEAESAIASHQTGRNSGVIHSGLYYRPGSLKASLCGEGRQRMYDYCAEKGIAHRRSGKIVVASNADELPRLRELEARARANGLREVRFVDGAELRELEPEVVGVAGLWVGEAGIVSYREVAAALARDFEAAGGEIRKGWKVERVRETSDGLEVITSAGVLTAGLLVNCAGLQSDRVARLCGVEPGVRIVPFRGEYYDLAANARPLVRNPIYPVPDPAFPFLGVHLTPNIEGGVEAGPNAVLAWRREGYRRTDFSFRDTSETFGYRGFRRLARRHWRYGLEEMARSFRKELFVRSVRRLVPRLNAEDLVPGKAGVRAQAVDPDGRLVDDFLIRYGTRSVHVLNAPSPAATASLSIAESIADHVMRELPAPPASFARP